MKMIALARGASAPVDDFPVVSVIPDSAITLPGKPLFVPDFAREWEACFMLGVRVSRLGKGVSARFASRYYDAVTLLMRLCPLPAASWPGGMASAFDGCIQQGEWSALPADLSALMTVGAAGLTLTLTADEAAIDRAVAAVARYLTIRNGDIIAPFTTRDAVPVKVGDIVEASLAWGDAEPAMLLRARLK